MENAWEISELIDRCAGGRRVICVGADKTDKELLKKNGVFEYVELFIGDDEFSRVTGDEILLIMSKSYLDVEKQVVEGSCLVYSWARKRPTPSEQIEKRLVNPALSCEVDVSWVTHGTQKFNRSYLSKRAGYLRRDDVLVIPYVSFRLNNACSLRCMDCSQRIPYMKTHWQLSSEQAIMYIDNFLRGVDECIKFILFGGEPFLNGDLSPVIYHLQKTDKVKYVEIITNGTIIPDEATLNALKSTKVHLVISDYGFIVEMARLVEVLEYNDIEFSIRTDMTWLDHGDIEYRGKDEKQLIYEYGNCKTSIFCKLIQKDKFFNCERGATLNLQDDSYDSERDCAVLNESDSDDAVKQKLRSLILADYMSACNYCDLGADRKKVIPAGRQLAGGRFGKKRQSQYTLVRRDTIPSGQRFEALAIGQNR